MRVVQYYLAVSTLRVEKHQQRAGAGRSCSSPEPVRVETCDGRRR